jgi:phosphoserine phosphatase
LFSPQIIDQTGPSNVSLDSLYRHRGEHQLSTLQHNLKLNNPDIFCDTVDKQFGLKSISGKMFAPAHGPGGFQGWIFGGEWVAGAGNRGADGLQLAVVGLPEGWLGADILYFDCDSTLAAIEGVDELATRKGVDVAALTAQAMAGELALGQIYRRRLELIRPDAGDLAWAADRYRQTVVPGAAEVVDALQQIGISCHVLSGGLLPALMPFALDLGFPATQIHAVSYPLPEVAANAEDFALATDLACLHPLARNGGKAEVIEEVCTAAAIPKARRMLVGDGASDLEAAPSVGLFVGFGGVENREVVAQNANVFLPGPGLHALAVLAAGTQRAELLQHAAPELFALGTQQLQSLT